VSEAARDTVELGTSVGADTVGIGNNDKGAETDAATLPGAGTNPAPAEDRPVVAEQATTEPGMATSPASGSEPPPPVDEAALAGVLQELPRTTVQPALPLTMWPPKETATHLDIVRALLALRPEAQPSVRLGLAGQQPQRELEQLVRWRVVQCAQRRLDLGCTQLEAAGRLGIHERTLRHWLTELPVAGPVQPLGRPLTPSSPEQQQAVFCWVRQAGPGIALADVQTQFDTMARAELDDIRKVYRRLWRAQNRHLLHVLHWQRPGSVWAMDFATAPRAVDEIYPHVLAVRDLASGQQLLWQAVEHQDAKTVIEAVTMLFTIHGAPLVLKSDNGSAFVDEGLQRILGSWSVLPLYSPPHSPWYNGAIESSIGSLKRRSERHACQAGHAGVWTSADVMAARLEANQSRPRRLHGATAAQTWALRAPLAQELRACFAATVEGGRVEARRELALPETGELSRTQRAAVDRRAIRRAFVAHDLLLFRRRRIPAPIPTRKVASKG
jgi:Integrase core domain